MALDPPPPTPETAPALTPRADETAPCPPPAPAQPPHSTRPTVLKQDAPTFVIGEHAPATPGRSAFADTPRPVPGATPAPPGDDPGRSGRPFGRYRLLAPLGAGGMGVVYQAWDTELQRTVALKQIKGEESADPDLLPRFQREARLSAGLRHPHIVPVHDVGEFAGKHFLTMDFVAGHTLHEFLAESIELKRQGSRAGLDLLRREVAWLAEIAGAVAYAHEKGVIHRDLKPGNVIVDHEGVPYVMDFGLAKQVEQAGTPERGPRPMLTETGQRMGTPAYMSPEQALGEPASIGPACDVWALGVMLYEILCGTTPFEWAETPWGILRAVLEDDPIRPRECNRHAPKELEAVCLKALERSFARRLRTAGELEAELRRWLRGEPVASRPPGPLDRLLRTTRRHRRWVVLGVALVAAIAATMAAVYFQDRAQGEQRHAQELQREVLDQLHETARLCVEETLAARRKGDLEPRDRLRQTLRAAYERARTKLPRPSPEPDFLMGRMMRACLDDDAAREHQERALAVDPDFAPALYELVLLRCRGFYDLYQRANEEELGRVGSLLARTGGLAPGATVGASAELRSHARMMEENETLRRARQAVVEPLERLHGILERDLRWADQPAVLLRVTGAKAQCAAGLLARYGLGDQDAAVRLLESAVASDPRLEEAYEALWNGFSSRRDHTRAAEACTRGLEADRGYVFHWLNRATARYVLAVQADGTGADPAPHLQAALADAEAAVALEPGRADAHLLVGHVQLNAGCYASKRGEDPGPRWEAAVAAFDRALARAPDLAEALRGRGATHAYWGMSLMSRGIDPLPHLDAAEADFSRLLAAPSAPANAWTRRGETRWWAARWLSDHGKDPDQRLVQAVDDCTRAIERDPTSADAWLTRAKVLQDWAAADGRRGRSPFERMKAAIQDCEHALKLDPAPAHAWNTAASLYSRTALFFDQRGFDPNETFAAAIAAYDRALERNPALADSWAGRGAVLVNLGLHTAGKGDDPLPHYERAIQSFGKALALQPGDATTWVWRGNAEANRAQALKGRGADALPANAAARECYGKAVALNASSPEAWMRLGNSWGDGAELLRGAGKDAGPSVAEAEAAYRKALELNPRYAEAYVRRGILRLAAGRERTGQGGDPRERFRSAVEDFDRAAALDPADFHALHERGRTRSAWALAEARGTPAREELVRAAIEDLDRSIARNPTYAPSRVSRGIARFRQGVDRIDAGEDPGEPFAAAAADYQEAVRLKRSSAFAWMSLGELNLRWADWRRGRGEDATGLYQAAATALESAQGLNPRLTGLDELLRRAREGKEAKRR